MTRTSTKRKTLAGAASSFCEAWKMRSNVRESAWDVGDAERGRSQMGGSQLSRSSRSRAQSSSRSARGEPMTSALGHVETCV
eukprot:10605215-Heterocapsa_arctica.AAC.1